MALTTRPARVNRTVVVLTVSISFLLIIGMIIGHQARKRVMTRRALTRGLAAYDRQQWPLAARELKSYLSARPTDADILEKYARAQLAIRPLEAVNLKAALNAYQALLELRPGDPKIREQLAALYFTIGNLSDLAYWCELRLKSDPHDLRARLWWARALAGQHKPAPAEALLVAVVEELDRKKAKAPEYVQACLLLSGLAQTRSSPDRTAALTWLERALAHDPCSVEARLARARWYRLAGTVPGLTAEQVRARAQSDLEEVDARNPSDPRVRLALGVEWLELGRPDRAAGEVDWLKRVSRDAVLASFTDDNDWITDRFLLEAQLALKTGNRTRAEGLVAETLSQLKNPAHRLRVLPTVVRIHLAGDNVTGARQALQDYLGTRHSLDMHAEAPEKVALLQAQVAAAGRDYYRVINLLEPLRSRTPAQAAFWGLLTEAYGKTNQPRLAVQAAAEYLKSRPRDHELVRQVLRALARQGRWDRLLKMARETQVLQTGDPEIEILCLDARTHLALGHGDTSEASTLLAEVTRLQPRHPARADLRRVKANLLIGLNRPEAAEAELQAARRECVDRLAPAIQLAGLYFQRGRSEQAMAIGQEVCRDHPQDARAWVMLSELQRMARRYPEARVTLETGRTRLTDPDGQSELSARLALLLLETGDRSAGVAMLGRLADQEPTNVEIRAFLVSLPEVQARPAAAQKWVDQIRRIEGETGLRWRLCQASLWLAADQWPIKQKEAADLLHYCVDVDPAWSAPVLALGRLYERLGQWRNAEGAYRRLLSANPAAVEVIDRLATLLEGRKRFADAREVLDRSPQVTAGQRGRRVQNALRAGDLPRAMDELDRVIHADPANANSRVLMARLVYAETRDAERAFKYLDEADALVPHTLAAAGTRVAILKAQGRLAEALAVLADFRRSGDPVSATLLHAEFLAAIGKTDQAEREYRRLVEIAADGRGYEYLGKFYTDAGRLDEAIETWRAGVKRFPDRGPLVRRMIKALLLRGRPADRAEAAAQLDALQRRHPNDPDLLWIRALVLLADQSPAQTRRARQLLEQVVRQQPTADEAHLKLIQLALREANFAAVRDLAIRALAVHSDNTSFLVARARAEVGLRNFPAAVQIARDLLRENPADADACGVLVEAAAVTRDPGRLQEAAEYLKTAVEKDPHAETLRILQTVVLRNTGRIQEAIAGLETFRRGRPAPKTPAVLLALAELYRGTGSIEPAGKCLDEAEKMAPGNPLVMRERILWLGARKQYDRIVHLLNRDDRGRANPGLLDAASAVLVDSGSPEWQAAAIPILEQWLDLAPRSVDGRLRLAWVLYRSKHYDRAENAYRQVLAIDPGNLHAVNNLAWLLSEVRGKHDEALALIGKGVQSRPRDTRLRDTRGIILSRIPGRLREAETDFQLCMTLAPPDSPEQAKALANLARTSMKLGDADAARNRAQKALRIDQRIHVFSPGEKSELEALAKSGPPAPETRKS